MRERLASLVSGSGSTMEFVVHQAKTGVLPLDIACVIGNETGTEAFDRAQRLGIPAIQIDWQRFRRDNGKIDQYAFGQELLDILQTHGATIVMQNGWLPLTPANTIEAYKDSFFNQHPGPLPETKALKGLQPHATMLSFARKSGRNEGTEVVIHKVTDKFDEGKIVGRKHVPIFLPYDKPERLQNRGKRAEKELQIKMLTDFLKGRIQEEDQKPHYLKPGEEELLKEVRKRARERYPNG